MEESQNGCSCLFCLRSIVENPNSTIAVGTSGGCDPGGGESLVHPDFETVCVYLQIKFPAQCFKPTRGGRREGGESCGDEGKSDQQQSIFRASCDKFLCRECCNKVILLKELYKQVEKIKQRIKKVTREVRRGILGEEKVVGNSFGKAFEDRLKKVTEECGCWKGEGHLKDACMEIKQEVEEMEIEVMEVDQPMEEFLVQSGAVLLDDGRLQGTENEKEAVVEIPSDSETEDEEGKGSGAEVDPNNPVLKQLKAIAGEIVNQEDKSTGNSPVVEKKPVFECPHCTKCYSALRNLEVHITSNHARNRKKIGTSKYSRDQLSLRAKSQMEVDGQIRYRCSFCAKLYEKVKALRNHIARNHAQGKVVSTSIIKCEFCTTIKTFSSMDRLQKHIFSMHTFGQKYKCLECDKAFCAKQSLKSHQDAEHKGVRYKCKDCPKFFTQEVQLKNHTKLAHLREGIFICEHCKREFVRKSDLTAHEIIHDPEAKKNHVCEQCGKEFLTRAGLADHLKVHTDERKYGCCHCPERFKKRSHLVAHERKHTGERPYKCNICEKRFAVNSTLTQHMKVHTEGEPRKLGRKKGVGQKKKKKRPGTYDPLNDGEKDVETEEEEENVEDVPEEETKVVPPEQIFAVL